MVTLNALGIIIYLRQRSLRKCSMYLVINQAVADIFVGGFVISLCWTLGNHCDFWTINYFSIAFSVLSIAFQCFFPLVSFLNLTAISLEQTHATFRPFKHRLVKKKIFGAVIAAVWITAGVFTTSIGLTFPDELLTFKECYDILLSYFRSFLFCLLIILCFLLVYSYKNCLWKSPSSPRCNQQRKKTDQNTVHCYSCILTANAARRYFSDSFFSVISHDRNPFPSSTVSVTFICPLPIFCKLFCQSSSLYI